MEINQQSDRTVHQFHIGEKLGLMHRKDAFNGFNFNNQTTIHNRIKS